VTVTLELKPEVEAELLARAQAAGLSLAEFLTRQLEAIAPGSPAQTASESNQWEKEFDEWADSFPQHPLLSEEALKRENWYADRW